LKIVLTNRTHYNDSHIRAFIQRIARDERPDLCKRGAPALKVIVSYRHNTRGSSGCAYLNSNWMTVRLPKDATLVCKTDFAKVVAHELAHTRGMTHATMRGNSRYRRIGGWRNHYAWAETLPLDVKQIKRKLKPAADAKLAHAQKMLKLAATREKRAVTLRKKWAIKVRYYEKRAAAPQPPPKLLIEGRKSKQLVIVNERLPRSLQQFDDRIDEIERTDGYLWLYYKRGWCSADAGSHMDSCANIREAAQRASRAERCECLECSTVEIAAAAEQPVSSSLNRDLSQEGVEPR